VIPLSLVRRFDIWIIPAIFQGEGITASFGKLCSIFEKPCGLHDLNKMIIPILRVWAHHYQRLCFPGVLGLSNMGPLWIELLDIFERGKGHAGEI
jgi:hypothetical protein